MNAKGGEQSHYIKAYEMKSMAREEQATVELFRFDPEIDRQPRYTQFKALPYKGYTVRDVLSYIYENLDDTFAFRWACNQGMCRACIVLVNGKPVLSCMEPARKNMKIEPHPKFKVIKDLIVDFDTLK